MNKYYILLLMLSFNAHAQIYKWVDENGNVHFGDKPTSTDAQELKIDTDNTNSSDLDELSRDEKRKRVLDAMNEDRLERENLKAEEKEKKAYKKMQCAQLKDKYRNVKKATGVYKLDENGERKFMSNKDRSQSEENLKRVIRKHCR